MEPLTVPKPPADALAPVLSGLIDRYRGALVGLLAAWGADDPAGLAQDVFTEAWLGRARFRGDWSDDAAVGPWLSGIARNLHREARRRGARRGPTLAEAPEPAVETDNEGEALRAAVRDAVDRLPEELRTVVRMRYLERTPQRVVAGLLGLTEKTVEGRLYRARKELARLLEGACRREEGDR